MTCIDIIGKNLKWRGKLVECNTFHAHGKKVSISQFTKGRTGKYRPTDKHSINCDRDTVIVENDMLRPNGTLWSRFTYASQREQEGLHDPLQRQRSA